MLETLPIHVRDRVWAPAAIASLEPRPGPDSAVIWWVHHAMRVEENPAFDAAVSLARAWNRPLLPIAVVGGRHPFNSDRHLTFALEGMRDLQRRLRGHGLDLAVIPRGPRDPSAIAAMAARAACVVTESMPAPPWPRWIAAIARAAEGRLIEIDASCLVPITRSKKAPDRAFAFRDRFARERAEALREVWPACDAGGVRLAALPEGSLDLETTSIADLVASLEIDHTVGPIFDTPGGCDAAMARWSAFRRDRLRRYARDRNDAAIDGTSRMSAYLHYGMASPFRIAREAAEDGAEKYLDELLIWRELAWHWAAHSPQPESLAALPAWALRTLEAHRADARDRVDDDALARGCAGEELWDLAQRSLLRHGELHNNLRMTWGKAIPRWSSSPEEAVRRLFELNHRFALDGCDPSSAGGLLWCLGLFDRPFEPEQPVLGSIRGRSIAEHAERLDLRRYRARVDRATRQGSRGGPARVAIVGAGIAGLVAARTLADHGLDVEVFDKGRGPGGRTSTRRDGEARFDHGAPCFTAADPRVVRMLSAWSDAGVVAEWSYQAARVRGGRVDALEDRRAWVGIGGMNAIAKHLASDLTLRCGRRIARLAFERRSSGSGWTLHDEGGDGGAEHGPFDAVILATPPSQAAELLGTATSASSALDEAAVWCQAIEMQPAWVAMVRMHGAADPEWSWLSIEDGDAVQSAVRQTSKPGAAGKGGESCWVLEASPEWATAHLELEATEAASRMKTAWEERARSIDGIGGEIVSLAAHRWRFARPAGSPQDSSGCRWVEECGLAIGGDWSHRGASGVERACLAGAAMAGRVLGCRGLEAAVSGSASAQASLFAI
ncbi:MAG: FAD-dependent oxidoreductase [Phycisphaerales bacterium]